MNFNGGSEVRLYGGLKGSADYIQMPGGLLEGLDTVTIEVWGTIYSPQNWGRVFSFGSGTGSVTNAYHLAWTRGTGINSQRYEHEGSGGADSNLVTTPGQQYYMVATYTTGPNQYEWYRDNTLAATRSSNRSLAQVDDTVMWLGRSQWNDSTADASWDEVRIYDHALTAEERATNMAIGPNLIPEPSTFVLGVIALISTAGLLRRRRRRAA